MLGRSAFGGAGANARPADRPRDLLRVVEWACTTQPEAPALVFEDGLTVSRAQLWDGAMSFAGYLSRRIQAGDRVAIMLDNRAEFMMAWLSTIACRGVLVPLNPTLRTVDAGHILRDSEARVAVVGADHLPLIQELEPECPALEHIVIVEGEEPDGLSAYTAPFELDRKDDAAGDITNVYYTSGTTGPPKGCMVDHEYWLRFVEVVVDMYGFSQSDRLLCCLQFFYNDPPWHLLLSLSCDTALVVMRRFSVSRYWDVVRRQGITVLFGIAATASLLLKAPIDGHERDHNVRLAIQVGIPAELHADLVERWGVPWVEGYGLTETGLIVAMPLDRAKQMIGSGSIGLPCPGTEIRVVDADDQDVKTDEIGEIVVRGPGLMRGYLNRPDATAEVMRGGWLHTGDLARRDEHGFLYFRGRSKDIIRRSGENIAAAEVEGVVRSHPMVLEAAAVPVPDPIRGEEVKIHVQLVPGVEQDDFSPEGLVEFCQERLARYKIPRYVQLRSEDFERTPSMRVKKDGLDRTPGELGAVWDREATLGW